MSIEEYVAAKQKNRDKQKNKMTRQQRYQLIADGKDPDELPKVEEVKRPLTRRGARKTN